MSKDVQLILEFDGLEQRIKAELCHTLFCLFANKAEAFLPLELQETASPLISLLRNVIVRQVPAEEATIIIVE